MNKSTLDPINKESVNEGLKYKYKSTENPFIDCVIASDTPKRLDFLILVIETLQINATDTLLLKAKDIGLSEDFSNRVHLWKIRCSNPLRNSYTYSPLSIDQIDSLVELISEMAENLYPLIRQLLSTKESKTLNNERWNKFSTRLKSLIHERMNIQRSYISSLLSDETNNYFRELLVILSLSCGEFGRKRLKASLFVKL